MRSTLTIAAAMLFAVTAAAGAETRADKGLRLYALAEAGSEYCPDIDIRTFIRPQITDAYGLDISAAIDAGRLAAERRRWFGIFREVPIRALACEGLMRHFGPGGSPHLFEWK